MSETLVEKIKQVFDDFDVVTFLEQHNVKYDEWLKSQIFQLLEAVEKDVLKILEGKKVVEQEDWDDIIKQREVLKWILDGYKQKLRELLSEIKDVNTNYYNKYELKSWVIEKVELLFGVESTRREK